MTIDWGKKPGQLMNFINPSKKGESIDCIASVISRSIGKEGVVSTRKDNMAKAPMARNNATRNNTVRYHRAGDDVIVIFVIRPLAKVACRSGLRSPRRG